MSLILGKNQKIKTNMFQSSPMDIGKQKEGEQTVLVEIESIQFLLRVNPFKGHYIVAIA